MAQGNLGVQYVWDKEVEDSCQDMYTTLRTLDHIPMVPVRQERALEGFLEIAVRLLLCFRDLYFLSFQE